MELNAYGALLDDVRRIRWPARRRVTSAHTGAHPSRRRGTLAEFVEYRAYRQGDDLRKLDWKLLARSDRPFLRLSHEQAILPTTLVLDASASMAFPVDTLDKWDLARRIAIALAAVARAGGDPVGLVVAQARGFTTIVPRTRLSVLADMARVVSLVPNGSPSLVDAVAPNMKRGGRLVILSDFLGDAESLFGAFRAYVAAGGEVYAVHVVAREELEPPRRHQLVLDPERVSLKRPLPVAALTEYRRRFATWRAQLAREWRTAGIVYVVAVTGEPVAPLVRRITTASR